MNSALIWINVNRKISNVLNKSIFSKPDPKKPNNLLQLDGIGINMVIKYEIETFNGKKKVRKEIVISVAPRWDYMHFK